VAPSDKLEYLILSRFVLNRLISILRLVSGFLLLASVTIPFLVIALLLLPWRVLRIKLCNYYGKFIGYSMTRIAGVHPIIKNKDRIQQAFPAIYVANHTSTLDAFLSIWLCPIGGCGIMKKEVLKIPFFGQLYWLSGHLWINRENTGAAIAAMNEAAEVMKKHQVSAWIMPEGTRSKDGRLKPFKKGFVHLAIATGFPIVPILLHGAHKAWEKGKWTEFHSQELEIEVLEAVDTSEWRVETAQEHAQHVFDLFATSLKDDQKPLRDEADTNAPALAASPA
jgi:1-acyl-sn-glycerol-3-phosphate acyltransferase